jgi:hypothetical protein
VVEVQARNNHLSPRRPRGSRPRHFSQLWRGPGATSNAR